MAARFTPTSNVIFWLLLLLVGIGATATVAVPMIYVRLPAATGQGHAPQQPIPFDHRHHASRDQIDCLYCHDQAETEAKANIPTTERCMGCHQQIWSQSPMLAPVRESYTTGKPIVWQRVNQLPDFVYFNHAIHVHKGIGCVTCHGRVDQMARVVQEPPLLMSWCVDCHRSPERHVRPRDRVTQMDWQPSGSAEVLGAQLAREYHVLHLTTCTTCHR
jgi:hypothetical protein